jgi:hypothetical protein
VKTFITPMILFSPYEIQNLFGYPIQIAHLFNYRRSIFRRGSSGERLPHVPGHESPRTTKLYDRTKERLTQHEVERIRL